MLNQGQTYLHKMEKGKGKKAKINRKISYVGLEDLILLECSYYSGDVQSQRNPSKIPVAFFTEMEKKS